MDNPHGFKIDEEWLAYEKGKQDEETLFLRFISKWNGETNSRVGELLVKKLKQIKPS